MSVCDVESGTGGHCEVSCGCTKPCNHNSQQVANILRGCNLQRKAILAFQRGKSRLARSDQESLSGQDVCLPLLLFRAELLPGWKGLTLRAIGLSSTIGDTKLAKRRRTSSTLPPGKLRDNVNRLSMLKSTV